MDIIEREAPLYTIYHYTDFIYRVVKFKRRPCACPFLADSDAADERLSQSYSRSRSMVLQLALCNEWDYFATLTLDPAKFDVFDLDSVIKVITQWFRDYRKVSGRLHYVLVPERHKSGAWHFHGFFSGILESDLSPFVRGIHPRKLVDGGYFNFVRFSNRFGYCSFSRVRNAVGAAFYVAKYVTKEMANDDYYTHLYFCSRGLKRARAVSDIYQYSPPLEDCLSARGDFCDTGWAFCKDWSWPLCLDGADVRVDGSILSDSLVPASPIFDLELINTFVESGVEYEEMDLWGGAYCVI